MQYPQTRLRRNRSSQWLRNLVQETELSVNDLVYPIFVTPEKAAKDEIKTMSGVFRLGEKELVAEVKEAKKLGINAIAIFPVVPQKNKDEGGSYALDKNNFLLSRVKKIKDSVPDIGIICDVALDPYTTHGHDGVLNKKNQVDNDKTIEILCKQAVLLAEAGADFVAPSDMMDGRIGEIRDALDAESLIDTGIISYSVKYASSLYAPFRDAVGSSKSLKLKDKKTYQMNPANIREAILEAQLDVSEGADVIMVKPGIFYLDVISELKNHIDRPIFAYQVSAEYSMMKHASLAGIIDFDKVMLESLICFKRAGADAIFTYAAKHVAEILK